MCKKYTRVRTTASYTGRSMNTMTHARCARGADTSAMMTVDNYGFAIIDLNVAGYKNDPWILAGNVAQVFYITDHVNAKKEIVLPGKQRVAGVDNITDPEEYNQFYDVPPFGDPKKLKQVEVALRRTTAIPYLRTDAKGKLVQGK